MKKTERLSRYALMAMLFGQQLTGLGTHDVRRVPVGREAREKYARENPDSVESRINLAQAKRERKASKAARDDGMLHTCYYRGWWKPKPSHDKPTHKEIRARMAQGVANV